MKWRYTIYMEAPEKTRQEELADWSKQVKIKDHYVCQGPDCGEMDRSLLESHHSNPKEQFPELALDLDNGECLCLPCHAHEHRANAYIYNMILARLAKILYLRIYPNRTLGTYKDAG